MRTSNETRRPELHPTRRNFLQQASYAGVTLIVPALTLAQQKSGPQKQEGKGEPISPAEDLMREHGVLNRILLIYDEHLRRLRAKRDFDPQLLSAAAAIVCQFVEDYHEKLEQDFLFPRFRKAGKLVELVDTLYAQH